MINLDKNQYGHMLCLFLAEGIRTRKIALRRSAEIAEHVLRHINLLETEADFLMLVKELSKDFEELVPLEGKMLICQDLGVKRDLELLVKDYVVSILPTDSITALNILQDASTGKFTLELLQSKYPEFKPEKFKR